LKHRPGIDQISVARLLGLDRSTTGMVIKKLEQAGLVGRTVGARDRRRTNLTPTRAGGRMLERPAEPPPRAQTRGPAAFPPGACAVSGTAREADPPVQRHHPRAARPGTPAMIS